MIPFKKVPVVKITDLAYSFLLLESTTPFIFLASIISPETSSDKILRFFNFVSLL